MFNFSSHSIFFSGNSNNIVSKQKLQTVLTVEWVNQLKKKLKIELQHMHSFHGLNRLALVSSDKQNMP